MGAQKMQAQLRSSARVNPPFDVAVIEDSSIPVQCRRQTHAEKRECRILVKVSEECDPFVALQAWLRQASCKGEMNPKPDR